MLSKFMKYCVVWLCLSLSACNFPGVDVGLPETPTPLPPTPFPTPLPFTPTPIPPSPTLPPPTSTVTLTPQVVPSLTMLPTLTRPVPTATYPAVVPVSRGKYDGQFEAGKFTLRINDKGDMVTLKMLNLRAAPCKEGGKVSESITFDSAVYFPIENAKFTITQGMITMNGLFSNPNTAVGSMTVVLRYGSATCTYGPTRWVAILGN